MENKELEECIDYFKERPVYRKLFREVQKKYVSLGHLGGTVQLTGLNEEECRQLSGFFQKDFSGKKSISISYAAMTKALKTSRFSKLEWMDILLGYFGEALIPKKEKRLAEQEKWNRYYAEVLAGIPENPGTIWLRGILQSREEGYQLLTRQYKENPEQLKKSLTQFLGAVPKLPYLRNRAFKADRELLAVFAAYSTGDPHFFDPGSVGEQLLIAFLKADKPLPGGRTISGAEEKAGLFYEAGLLKDDLSNNTLVYGIHARTKDGKRHEGIEGFLVRREPLLLTLMTIGKLDRVWEQGGKCVYIVENPAVFSTLAKEWPERTILCGNGQIRLATLILLDLFDDETNFFYAGDFDPEGLQIAQRLKERYGERMHLWNYKREIYEAYQSHVKISDRSLKKLDKIYLKELKEIKTALLEEKKAAYQEAMIQEYLSGAEPC